MSGSGPALSPLDRERFGVVTARWDAASDAELADALAFCREHDVELLIARCDTSDATAAHGLERAGALLMDTMIHFACDPARRPSDDAEAPPIRSAAREDATQVREIAGEAFRGYVGHYHADPRLDRAAADEVYPDWAYRSCLTRDPPNAHPRGPRPRRCPGRGARGDVDPGHEPRVPTLPPGGRVSPPPLRVHLPSLA
jgi:hypothetical protein